MTAVLLNKSVEQLDGLLVIGVTSWKIGILHSDRTDGEPPVGRNLGIVNRDQV